MSMTAQQLLTRFRQRDAAAVDDFNDGPRCIETKLQFVDGRLDDLCTLVIFLLECEIEREK